MKIFCGENSLHYENCFRGVIKIFVPFNKTFNSIKMLVLKIFFHVCSALFEKFCFFAEYATMLGPLIERICTEKFLPLQQSVPCASTKCTVQGNSRKFCFFSTMCGKKPYEVMIMRFFATQFCYFYTQAMTKFARVARQKFVLFSKYTTRNTQKIKMHTKKFLSFNKVCINDHSRTNRKFCIIL